MAYLAKRVLGMAGGEAVEWVRGFIPGALETAEQREMIDPDPGEDKKEEVEMKIGVCGIACEKCPRMVSGNCPVGEEGCHPRENAVCMIASCAHDKCVDTCFECLEFPCQTTKEGPINIGFCGFIAGKET
jgi:hypothetical protein